MQLAVKHRDASNNVTTKTFKLTRLAFAKHFAIAGLHYAPRPQKISRIIAMFFHYMPYLQRGEFYSDKFSLPSKQFSDPTEQGQFSNLAGKAIADFLSKRIDNSIYTVNYEAAMRIDGMPVKGQRPDLLAYTQNSVFAIEAKGRAGVAGSMKEHKKQSESGKIPVYFSVACISYNIYSKIKCNYYDPYSDDIQYNSGMLRELTKRYYYGLSLFLNEEYFEYSKREIEGENFYIIRFNQRTLEKTLQKAFLFKSHYFLELFNFYQPKIILPGEIFKYAENGISRELKPFKFEASEQSRIYIDNDRVGLQIEV